MGLVKTVSPMLVDAILRVMTRDGPLSMWPRLSTSEYRFLWMYSIVLTRSAFRLAVSRVEWNVTGYVYLQSNFDGSLLCSFCRTILSSAGNDGRVRLWKVGTDGEWKSAGSISVEQAEQESKADQRNVGTVWIRSVAMSAIALNIGSYLSHLLLSVPMHRTIRTPSTRTVRTNIVFIRWHVNLPD